MDPRSVLMVLALISASTDVTDVHVESDRNARLECQGPENAKLVLLEWKRQDLLSDGYVFFYRDDRLHKSFQHPMFKGRVRLRDPQMTNGDMSIVLYKTTINDTGTYECRIITGDTGNSYTTNHKIRLKVKPPGPSGGLSVDTVKQEEAGLSSGFIGLLMSLGFLAVSVVICATAHKIPKKKGSKSPSDSSTSDKKETDPSSAAP